MDNLIYDLIRGILRTFVAFYEDKESFSEAILSTIFMLIISFGSFILLVVAVIAIFS